MDSSLLSSSDPIQPSDSQVNVNAASFNSFLEMVAGDKIWCDVSVGVSCFNADLGGLAK